MLPAAHRMHRSTDFTSAVRAGTRVRADCLVMHQHLDHLDGSTGPALVGLVVSRSVGSSVVRHQVSRRLRAQLAARVGLLPAGSATVVRALPGCAGADSARLGAGLDRGLQRLSAARP